MAVFIVREELVFYSSHETMKTGHYVYKVKIIKNKKEEKEQQNVYKLSLLDRLKFFGLSLRPKERQRYDIVPLKKGYGIRKR